VRTTRKVLAAAALVAAVAGCAPPSQRTAANWRIVRDPNGSPHDMYPGDRLVSPCHDGYRVVHTAGNDPPYCTKVGTVAYAPPRYTGLAAVFAFLVDPNITAGRSTAGFWAGRGMAAPSWGLGR
jgi:hypothetical protein